MIPHIPALADLAEVLDSAKVQLANDPELAARLDHCRAMLANEEASGDDQYLVFEPAHPLPAGLICLPRPVSAPSEGDH